MATFAPVPRKELEETLEWLKSDEFDEMTLLSWAVENVGDLIIEILALRAKLKITV